MDGEEGVTSKEIIVKQEPMKENTKLTKNDFSVLITHRSRDYGFACNEIVVP